MKELNKTIIILSILPIFMALVSVMTTSKWFIIAILFPLFTIFLTLNLDERPLIHISVSVEKNVMYVGDELKVKVHVSVDKGFGLLILRSPPIPNTQMAEGFELVKGTNVHVIFKGFKKVNKNFEYTLKALKRGIYALDKVEYTFYHPFGIHEIIKDFIHVKEEVKVLPRIKIIYRIPNNIKPREAFPRFSPSKVGPYSTDFKSIRNYEIGDPYKFINWKATARNPGNELMINEYEREGVRSIIILLDRSQMMRFGTEVENSLEYGISLILSLSKVLLRQGYNVGLWTIPSGEKVIPSSDSDQYYRLMNVLMRVRGFPSYARSTDKSVLNAWNKMKPIMIIVTNVMQNNLSFLSSLVSHKRAIIVDIIPDNILLKNVIEGNPCNDWFIRDKKESIYEKLPSNIKVLSWDPVCESIGKVVAKISKYMADL